jgi:hypothetical protein
MENSLRLDVRNLSKKVFLNCFSVTISPALREGVMASHALKNTSGSCSVHTKLAKFAKSLTSMVASTTL